MAVTVDGRPCTPSEAVACALDLVGHAEYELGTGDCDTPDDAPTDCAGFAICKCYHLRRHRPGYNVGPWASVSDDLNSNSIIEDARHARALFTIPGDVPQLGDLIAYPTIRIHSPPGLYHTFVGHVVIVVGVSRVLVWDPENPDWSQIDIVQCCGPNGRRPGIIRSDASHFCQHDHQWPRPEHRSVLLRAVA